MPRILQGIERDVFTCCTCSGLFLGIQDFSFTESVLKKRVACIGTMQIIKGLGIPNKHFATQKWRLYSNAIINAARATERIAKQARPTLAETE